MISADQATRLIEECKKGVRESFMVRHASFMDELEQKVKEKCSLEQRYLKVDIKEKEKFTKTDFLYLLKYLHSEMKYTIRSADDGEYSFEMFWGTKQ